MSVHAIDSDLSESLLSSEPINNASSSSLSKRRSVRFPDDDSQLARVVCSVPNREEWTPEECSVLYFNKEDFAAFRRDSRTLSMETSRKGAARLLDSAFSEKSTKAQTSLNEWVTLLDGEARGLERWCNSTHGETRENFQFQMLMTVLSAQDEMLASRKSVVNDEQLRKIAYKESRLARHFARMMGKADQFAIDGVDSTTTSKDHDVISLAPTVSTALSEGDASTIYSNGADDNRSKGSIKRSLRSRLPFFQRHRNRPPASKEHDNTDLAVYI